MTTVAVLSSPRSTTELRGRSPATCSGKLGPAAAPGWGAAGRVRLARPRGARRLWTARTRPSPRSAVIARGAGPGRGRAPRTWVRPCSAWGRCCELAPVRGPGRSCSARPRRATRCRSPCSRTARCPRTAMGPRTACRSGWSAAAAGCGCTARPPSCPTRRRAARLLRARPRRRDGAPVIVAVDPGRARASVVEPQPVVDETRRLAMVTRGRRRGARGSVWRFAGDPQAAVGRLLDRAAVAVACDSLGLSEAMLDADRRLREGAASSSAARSARSRRSSTPAPTCSSRSRLPRARDRGGVALADEPSPASTGGTPAAERVAASMAKSYACAAAVDVAGKAMQLHGGIGYTWESGIHVFLKRAALNRSLFGSPGDAPPAPGGALPVAALTMGVAHPARRGLGYRRRRASKDVPGPSASR